MGLIRAIRSLWYLWRMRGVVYDYEQSIQGLVGSLRAMQDYIRKHGHLENGAQVVAEIEIFIAAYHKWSDEAYFTDDEDAAWNAMWDYFRDHARAWWD